MNYETETPEIRAFTPIEVRHLIRDAELLLENPTAYSRSLVARLGQGLAYLEHLTQVQEAQVAGVQKSRDFQARALSELRDYNGRLQTETHDVQRVAQAALERATALESALTELVRLKDLKDATDGGVRCEEYEHCRPYAWWDARSALAGNRRLGDLDRADRAVLTALRVLSGPHGDAVTEAALNTALLGERLDLAQVTRSLHVLRRLRLAHQDDAKHWHAGEGP